MSEKTLILLTKQFPYQQREQYVAHELEYLAKSFNKVLIYPHDHFGKGEKFSFSLPSNVEVIDLNSKVIPAGKMEVIMSFLKAFFYEFFRSHSKVWFLKNVRRFFAIYATQFALGKGLVNFLEQRKIDPKNTVFYSYWFSASALCLAILKSENKISRFVSRAHALDLYHEDWGLLNEKVRILPFRNFKQNYVDVIYSISKHGKDYLDKNFPSIDEVEIAYLGVKDAGLNPSQKESVFVIATCSGIDDNKRIHKLGEALSVIDQPVRWIHFGDGPLKEKALNSIHSRNVEFIWKGQTPNQEIRTYYSTHHIDLFVNLSLVEGLPVTIMEALAHGIPVLATDANGTPEAVLEGVTGKLINVHFEASDLENALLKLMNDAERLQAMRESSRILFLEKFDANKNYAAFGNELASN